MNYSILKEKNILIGVSGSISAAGISAYLLYFKNYFKEIRVIMTPTAEKFIPATTISYFCDKVYTEQENEDSHITIGRWADVYCILPATANIIGQTANGVAMNLLTTTVLGHPYSTIFFPTMNELMWEKKVVYRNIEQLREDGHIVVDPVKIMAFEVSSGERKSNPTMLPPDKALLKIKEAIENRTQPLPI